MVAVNEENPIEAGVYSEAVPIELLNTPSNLILTQVALTQTTVSLRAPRSIWETLSLANLRITADLTGLSAGTHEVPLHGVVDIPATQITSLQPASLSLTLEERASRERPVRVEAQGEPAPGYEPGEIALSALVATVSGPASAVDRVSEILAVLTLDGSKRDINTELALVPVDTAGKPVTGVALNPLTVQIILPITQKIGYRDVAVSPVITGQVASGYRITNITVSPLIITVSSADPLKVSELLGFVNTEPLDISGASDDIIQQLALALPPGVSLVGNQSVLVQVNIAAIESGLTVPRQLELQGLGVGLAAMPAPATVDVILTGPLPLLDQLQPTDVRVMLDLTGLTVGTYQISPEVILLSSKLRAESVLPSVIEVVITEAGTATPTPTITPTPTTLPTPTPTRRPPPTVTPTPSPTPTLAAPF
jgi:YbbR domain-containing protein